MAIPSFSFSSCKGISNTLPVPPPEFNFFVFLGLPTPLWLLHFYILWTSFVSHIITKCLNVLTKFFSNAAYSPVMCHKLKSPSPFFITLFIMSSSHAVLLIPAKDVTFERVLYFLVHINLSSIITLLVWFLGFLFT